MKCQKCKSEIDSEILIDEWYHCPLCNFPMFGFRDDMLDLAVEKLLDDTRTFETRLFALSDRLREMKK